MTAALLIVCLACLIAGEAGNCDVRTQIAVAHVFQNRQDAGIEGGWYGWAAPTEVQARIAREWREFADPTGGATMLVNDADLPHVARYTVNMRETYTSTACANGQRLHAFRMRRETP